MSQATSSFRLVVNTRQITYLVFIMLLMYVGSYEIFERLFFFNELLSMLGVFIFIRYAIKPGGILVMPKSTLYRLIFGLLMLGFLHLLSSLFRMTTFYFYFRNSVIVYSMFTFFLGFYLFEFHQSVFNRLKKYLLGFYALALAFPQPYLLLQRYTGGVMLPFLFKKINFKTVFLILLFNVIYAQVYGGITAIAAALLLVGIIAIKKFSHFKMLALLGIIIAISGFLYFAPALSKYKTPPYFLYGNMYHVISENVLLAVDPNTTWRMVLWYNVLVDRFPENLIGVGMGTPLIHYEEGAITTADGETDAYIAHVNGAHNTFFTLFTRLGFLFPVLLFFIYYIIFKEFYKYRSYYRESGYSLQAFIAFFGVSIVGLFNLVLESPLGAVLYWILLGMVAKTIFNRKRMAHQL